MIRLNKASALLNETVTEDGLKIRKDIMENHVKNSLRRSYIIRDKSLIHMVIFHKLMEM
jgi:hypothetical protein